MSPDDPRHGTYAGTVAHWFDDEKPCGACWIAENRYRKTRKLRVLNGDPSTVSMVGTLRRIQALHALGHTGPVIAEALGLSVHTMRSIQYRVRARVNSRTAEKIAAGYERLSMVRPEGRYANRARAMASRKGYLPPLAWDNIDDPDESPTDWQYVPATRAETFADLVESQASVSEACRRLDLSPGALEKWADRAGLRPEFNAMNARERAVFEQRNQWSA